MATVKLKTEVTMGMEAACVSHSRTDVHIRDLTLVIDEPPERGGGNAGPAPTETMIAALAGCTNVIGHKCAAANGVEITAMTIRIKAQFDRRGVTLTEEIEVPFPALRMEIDLVSPSSAEAIEAMKQDLRKFCPVSKVIRHSGTRLEEVWNISRP